MKKKEPCIYILTNKPRGTLYIGMTTDLVDRMEKHLSNTEKSFVTKYKLYMLVHVEFYPTINEASAREMQLKHWKREWKLQLIEEHNPEWCDLKLELL